jgi:hypothetical protein
MRKRRWSFGMVWLALLLLGPALVPAAGRADEGKVEVKKLEVKVAKLDALKDLIKQHKGKVVVVDFWSNT